MKKASLWQAFSKGIIKENPVLCLLLGTCPTLAVTTSASNALGMGVAATLVLICSNCVISLLRRVIPDSVRIPAFITVIAGFVTVVQMLVKAYLPALDGLGMGVGFTAAMLLMGMIRELLGTGCLFGLSVLSGFYTPITVFILPAGGFFVFGLLIALAGRLQGGKRSEEMGCGACPMRGTCGKADCEKEGKEEGKC